MLDIQFSPFPERILQGALEGLPCCMTDIGIERIPLSHDIAFPDPVEDICLEMFICSVPGYRLEHIYKERCRDKEQSCSKDREESFRGQIVCRCHKNCRRKGSHNILYSIFHGYQLLNPKIYNDNIKNSFENNLYGKCPFQTCHTHRGIEQPENIICCNL